MGNGDWPCWDISIIDSQVSITGPQPWDVVCKSKHHVVLCFQPRHASILFSGTEPWQRHYFWLVLLVILGVAQAGNFFGLILARVFFYIWVLCVFIYIISYVCFPFFIIYYICVGRYYAGIIVVSVASLSYRSRMISVPFCGPVLGW